METEDNDCEMIEIKKVHIKELSWCALATAFAQNLEKLKTFSLEDIIEFVISPAALAGLKSEPKLTESDSAESQDTTSGACSQKEGCEASEQKKEVWEEKKVTRSRSNAKAPPEAQAILMRYDIVTKDLIASQTAKAQEQQSQQNSLKSLSAQHLQVPEMREVHDFVVRENKKHAVVEIIQLFFENYFMLSKNNSWDGTAVKHLITLHNILTKFSCGIIDKVHYTTIPPPFLTYFILFFLYSTI